mmetsp:Transcript_20586/g.38312  ORF Transcript_20586/g.38312 Transcript_20586/m.38312 type:complete len:204 (+) Transcript_20586:60-671(+)
MMEVEVEEYTDVAVDELPSRSYAEQRELEAKSMASKRPHRKVPLHVVILSSLATASIAGGVLFSEFNADKVQAREVFPMTATVQSASSSHGNYSNATGTVWFEPDETLQWELEALPINASGVIYVQARASCHESMSEDSDNATKVQYDWHSDANGRSEQRKPWTDAQAIIACALSQHCFVSFYTLHNKFVSCGELFKMGHESP